MRKCVCQSGSTFGTDLGDDEFEGRFKLLHVRRQSAHQLPCLLSVKERDVLAGAAGGEEGDTPSG